MFQINIEENEFSGLRMRWGILESTKRVIIPQGRYFITDDGRKNPLQIILALDNKTHYSPSVKHSFISIRKVRKEG